VNYQGEINMQKVFLIDGINFSDPMDFVKNSLKKCFQGSMLGRDEVCPTNTNLEQDVLNGQMYVGIKDCEIVSAIVINNECEEEYKNGNWRYDNDRFAVVRRLCVNPIHQNKNWERHYDLR
jgi:hypothetical protein